MKDEIIVEKLKRHHVLFFWHGQESLPTFYYQLKAELKNIGIYLLPLKESGFYLLPKSYHWQVLVFRKNMAINREFEIFREKYLENSFLSGKMHLLDLSSFSSLKEMTSAQKFFKYKKNSYSHFPLPLSLDQITQEITVSYFHYHSNVQKEATQVLRPKMPSLRL